jgi:hypothetical protein
MSAPVRPATLSAAAVLLLIGLPSIAGAQRVEGRFERTLTVTAPADVEVVSGSGSIEVRPGSSDRIEVTARISAREGGFGRSSLSAEERVRRIEANPPIEQTGNRVRIGVIDDEDVREGVSISYMLTVPSQTTLQSRTGSGSHIIEGLRGAIEAASGSGSIRIRDAGSEVRASTGSGSIDADNVRGSFRANSGSGSILGFRVGDAIDVRTGSGRIDVTQDGSGDVEASSGSGSITLSGIRGGVRASAASGSLRVQGEPTSEWRLSTASGSVTIELAGTRGFTLDAHSNSGGIETAFPVAVVGTVERRSLRGEVNGGGPLLYVRSASGSIRIR